MDIEGGNHEPPWLHSSIDEEWLSIMGIPSRALDNRAFDIKFWTRGFLLLSTHV